MRSFYCQVRGDLWQIADAQYYPILSNTTNHLGEKHEDQDELTLIVGSELLMGNCWEDCRHPIPPIIFAKGMVYTIDLWKG